MRKRKFSGGKAGVPTMKTSKKFTKDVGWKLLSLAIAIGLWFMVINTENPTESRTYTTTIELQNAESLFERGYVVVNADEISSTRISVRLRGQRLALDRLSQSSTKVQAVVDLSDVIYSYDGDPVSVAVDIVIPSSVNNSFEILYKSIQTVSVDIQPYINKDFEINTVVNYGDEGMQNLINAAVSPSTITAYGAKSVVNSISEVRAEISPETIDGDSVFTVTPVAYDAEGSVVDNVTFSSNEVSIRVSMDDMKQVSITADVSGEAADGYEVTEVLISPSSIDVAGNADDLAALASIVLPDIDVSGADESVIQTFNVGAYLPEGVRTIGPSETVTVTVTIEEETTADITIYAEDITDNGTLDEGLFAKIRDDEVTVTVSGKDSIISELDADDIKAYVNLSGYEAGTYEDVPLRFVLPDGVSLVGDTPIITVVIN